MLGEAELAVFGVERLVLFWVPAPKMLALVVGRLARAERGMTKSDNQQLELTQRARSSAETRRA